MESETIEEFDDVRSAWVREPASVGGLDDAQEGDFVDGGLGVFECGFDDFEGGVAVVAGRGKGKASVNTVRGRGGSLC